MDKCTHYCSKQLYGVISGGLLFIGLFFAQATLNLGHAAEQTASLNNPVQVAWWWGPDRGYYARHYWGGWHRGPVGCQERCFHNRYTGAIVRCERVCY